jgi:hypothetical protein
MGINDLEIITTRDGSKMKIIQKIIPLVLLMLLILTGYTSVAAQASTPPPPINEDKVVIGQNFILQEDQILNGDLAVIGATAILKEGSQVNGDIALIGGVLRVNGTITGDIQALGGSVDLMQTAVVEGSLYNFSSNLNQEDGAVINGQQISSLPFEFNFGDFTVPETPAVTINPFQEIAGFVGNFLLSVLQILAFSALAMLVVLLAPKSTDRLSKSIAKQPFVHWGIGLLSAFTIPVVLVVAMITIILIPISLVGFIIFALSMIYGWIALGYTVGTRLISNRNHSMSPAVIAGFGTLIVTVIARFAALVPCVGWTIGAALSLFGLGAVVLTRFGTRDYPVETNSSISTTPSPTSLPDLLNKEISIKNGEEPTGSDNQDDTLPE